MPVPLPLNEILLCQSLNDILPFTYYGEDKFNGTDTILSFKFRTSRASYFDYSNVLNPVKDHQTVYPTYLPEKEDSKYTHAPIFFVDLITDDKSGVSKISARGQEDRFETRTPKYTFVIPRFSWKTKDIKSSVVGSSGLKGSIGSVWIGSTDKNLYKIQYSVSTTVISNTVTQDSQVDGIAFNPKTNSMYLTCYDHLRKYSIDSYILSNGNYSTTINKESELYNDANKKIVLNEDNEVWTVNSYKGTINKLDPENLNEISSIKGFDAPFKIVKSEYHNCYFVSGSNILWKYDGVSKKPIYEIGGYKIFDFDVSNYGEIAITFNSLNDSIFRVVDKNLFHILYNEKIYNGKFRSCKYCSNNKFYAIAEIQGGTYDYGLSHYLFDLNEKNIVNLETGNDIHVKQSSSSEGAPTTQKIELSYPIGSEEFSFNQTITIKWKSTQSVKDTLSIDLYKDGDFYLNIVQMDNTGYYTWKIPDNIEISGNYQIKVTWLAPAPNDYSDISAYFTIDQTISSSSGLIIPIDVGQVAGVDFDPVTENVVVVLKNGYLGFFETKTNTFFGLLETGVSDVNCVAVKSDSVKEFDTVTKVRLFVGTQKNLNDKWDSGEVETDLSAMYYGGGNNLTPGEKYYINIQVYSEFTGWSEVQTREFIMPCKRNE